MIYIYKWTHIILTRNQNCCQSQFNEYKKSHNNLVLIYEACCILYDFNQTINDNNLDIGKELSNFNIIDHGELSKLINQQKYLMKKIENIKQQINPLHYYSRVSTYINIIILIQTKCSYLPKLSLLM